MILKQYGIAARIGFVVGTILFLMLGLALIEMNGLNKIRNSLDEIVGIHYQRLQTAQDMRFLARHGAVLVRNLLLVSEDEDRQRELHRFEEANGRYATLLAQLTVQEMSDQEQVIIQKVKQGGDVTFSLWRIVVEPENQKNSLQGMQTLEVEVRNHQWGWLSSLDELVRLEQRLAENSMQQALNTYSTTKTVMAMVNVLAMGAGIFMVVVISAGIIGPLRSIGRKVDRIASGDFNTRIDMPPHDEIGTLAGHINKMVEKLAANEQELNAYRYQLEGLLEQRTGEYNEQRERFISVLIHDLKGPLVPILGFSRLLLSKKDLTDEKIKSYAREIHNSSAKLSFTIEKTSRDLKQKRIDYDFDREPFDFEELLFSVSSSCKPELDEEGIVLQLNDEPLEQFNTTGRILYSGDIGKIRNLLENLLGNACKYAESIINVDLANNDESVRLVVDDDGQGVAEPFRKKIFEEYYQAPNSKEGSGVGLYSVKRVVDHYQGSIEVAASPYGGARFLITLPSEKPAM